MAKASEPRTNPVTIVVQIGFVLLAAALVYYFVLVTREGELRRVCSAPCLLAPSYLGADKLAPDFALDDGAGRVTKLSDLRGKVVVLNFWTKTCGPCLEEMPEIADLTRIVADRSDVRVVAVSVDDGPSEAEPVLKSVLSGPIPFTVLYDRDSKIVGGKYGTKLFPETWVIDKRGVIRARFDGAKQWSNAAVVEFIDDLRRGDYCPVQIDAKAHGDYAPFGKAAKLCGTETAKNE